jgi:RNA polymerase sigma-70 factor (ECF subfamily)
VVEIPAGTTELRIALQIYGPGTVWFDDLSAEYVPNDTPVTDAAKSK